VPPEEAPPARERREARGGRAEAVLAVLRGVSLAEVAKRAGTSTDEVLNWVDTFCEAGEARLAEAPALEPTGRDRFLTLIAHEFKTPLSIIGGWADLLSAQLEGRRAALEGQGAQPEGQGGTQAAQAEESPTALLAAALPAIRRQVSHLERVARDALDAGAAARGQLRLMVAPLKLRDLIDSVLMSMRDPHLVLLPGPEVEVVADASRLEQVVGGLLEHARRLADEGTVSIEVDTNDDDQVAVRASVEGKQLAIGDAAALLEPYARADTSFGTGLGLYLCRTLLVAHGGEIGLRSEGMRTVFWFSLPRSGPEPSRLVQRS
jgi:two-component system OmpR family sensor kinase